MRLGVVIACLIMCTQGCSLLLTPLKVDDGGDQDSSVDADVGDDADLPDAHDSGDADIDADGADADTAADAADADDAEDAEDAEDADDADDADEDLEPPLATSCAELLSRDAGLSDGNYDIFVGGHNVEVYCDMSNGGWTRVVHFDAATDECPGDWVSNDDPLACRIHVEGCDGVMASAYFDPDLEEYSEVRGYARGYQRFSMDAFDSGGADIDEFYVEGLSITFDSSPRQHIWTLATGLMMMNSVNSCPCDGGTGSPVFVGDHYYCDSGNPGPGYPDVWYTEEPLWGGGEDVFCDVIGDPAWFERDLDVTTSEPIEVRIMQDSCDENTGVYELELYVR